MVCKRRISKSVWWKSLILIGSHCIFSKGHISFCLPFAFQWLEASFWLSFRMGRHPGGSRFCGRWWLNRSPRFHSEPRSWQGWCIQYHTLQGTKYELYIILKKQVKGSFTNTNRRNFIKKKNIRQLLFLEIERYTMKHPRCQILIMTSSAIDKMLENFEPIFEQNAEVNFGPIFVKKCKFRFYFR